MEGIVTKSKDQQSLTEWTKQKWEFVGDDKKEMKKPRSQRGRYAPKSVADSMTASQKASENKKKRQGHKKGKQHVPRGKGVKPMYQRVEKSDAFDAAWELLKAKKKSKPFHGYNPSKHHRKGGLSAKGRAKAKRETGANLKPPVTTKPSKLKPGSKKAKRRKSFCARMTGVKGPTSKKGKLTPKGAALKRWNC